MRLIVDNVKTKLVIGGKDHLVDNDPIAMLRKYLRVRPKGYAFSPLYKKRQWDGWTYYITPKGEFATGFLPMVAGYLEELGYTLEVEDIRGDIPRLGNNTTNFVGTIEGVDWFATGKYDYQYDCIHKIDNYIKVGGHELYFPRGIYDCATNAGKNSLAALFIRNYPEDCEVVFMVSSTVIYKQAIDFLSDAFGKDQVGQVGNGKYDPKRITVCMVKTLLNRGKDSANVKKWLKRVNILIVDESDEAGGKEYSTVLSWIAAPIRIFVSGTPLDGKVSNAMVALGLSGKVLFKITNKELIEKGVSQNPKIKVLLNNSGKLTLPSYDAELDQFVHKSEHRVSLIADEISKSPVEPTLIIFNIKEHGHFMLDYLVGRFPDRRIEIIHGTIKNRATLLQEFKDGKIDILLASMVLKRGANVPIIRVGYLAQSGKSKTTGKQLVGRFTRHDGIFDDVILYDFYDEGKYIGKHSRDRIRTYKAEGFEVEYLFEEKRGKPVK